MAELVYIPDHEQRALDKMPWYFRGKPRSEAFLREPLSAVQFLEDTIIDILIAGSLEGARSYMLDNLGEVVGEQRGGFEDFEYRRFIAARILANRSPTTDEAVIKVFKILVGDGVQVRHFNTYPSGFALVSYSPGPRFSLEFRIRVRRLIESMCGGGTTITLIESAPEYFTLDSGPGFGSGPLSRAY